MENVLLEAKELYRCAMNKIKFDPANIHFQNIQDW